MGKTSLLRAFCSGRSIAEQDPSRPAEDLSVIVPAPVDYDRKDFMLHLYALACRSTVAYVERHAGKAIAGTRGRRGPRRGQGLPWRSDRPLGLEDVGLDALARFEQVRFLQTYSSEMTGELKIQGLGLGGKRGLALARQPLTYPEIVGDLREFLTSVAASLRAHGERSGARARLVVGIDELDRIRPAERAREFIDEIKVVFDIPNCIYLVSISNEALRAASLASPGNRDAFDSAIDEVLRVNYLDFDTAGRLLDRRVVGLPLPFAALAHVLSGGLARDLLRTARTMVDGRGGPLPEVARDVVAQDFTELVHATVAALTAARLDSPSFEVLRLLEDGAEADQDCHSLHELSARVADCAKDATGDHTGLLVTISVWLDHLSMVSSVFGADLTAQRIEAATRPGPASFVALARIRRTTGSDDALVRRLLTRLPVQLDDAGVAR